ncbi:MAG: MFS transporter [Acidimicrobiia bacterium]|nr:MFS transporter [Acidimicrobiia bacterium]
MSDSHIPPASGGTFESLRTAVYRLLFTTSVGIFLAVTSQAIARGWLAFELTGTNAGLGGVMLGFGLAMLVATPWGGVAADRFPKRLILLSATGALALSSAWIGLAVVFDVLSYWMLVGASAIQAVSFAFYGPARMAFTAELVEPRTLANAVVLGQVSMEATRVVGPAAAGVLIGVSWFGPGGVFLTGAALCTLSAVFTRRLPPGRATATAGRRSPFGELHDAFLYMKSDPPLLLLAGTSLLVVIAGMPYLTFLPALAEEVHDAGPQGYGLMSAVGAVGAVAAGLATARATASSAWRRMGTAGFAMGVGLVGTAMAPSLSAALPMLFVVGGASLAFQTTSQSMVLTRSDAAYHGRLQAAVMLGFSGFGIVALPLGLLADEVGLPTTLGGMGVAILVTMSGFLVGHRLLVAQPTVRPVI